MWRLAALAFRLSIALPFAAVLLAALVACLLMPSGDGRRRDARLQIESGRAATDQGIRNTAVTRIRKATAATMP